jgi:hypothetical protein
MVGPPALPPEVEAALRREILKTRSEAIGEIMDTLTEIYPEAFAGLDPQERGNKFFEAGGITYVVRRCFRMLEQAQLDLDGLAKQEATPETTNSSENVRR